ncbi:MAG: hypothetical protein WC653_02170 [Candidatus Gracilibacteria bacterium]
MPENPQERQLAQAYDISDELARERVAYFPHEFLQNLQKTDEYLFQEFLALSSARAAEEDTETVSLLDKLDTALTDFEQKTEAAKSPEAKYWLAALKDTGFDDSLVQKLLDYADNAPTPLGVFYSNHELMPPGFIPSLETDRAIVAMIKGRFTKNGRFSSDKLYAAYQGALLDPRSEDSRVAKEAADFILMKIPVFKGVRKKAAVQKAAAEAARQRSETIREYVDVYADTPVGELLVDAKNVVKEIYDAGNVTSAASYGVRLKDLAKQMEDSTDDVEDEARVEEEIRKIYGEMLVDADALRKPEVLAEPLSSEAEETPGEQAVVQSQSESVPAATQPEVKEPEINSEAKFFASLKNDGWKKYADLTPEADGAGTLVFKGLDKGTPEYIHSRLHHFFGLNGAAVKEDPSKLDITVNGAPATWGVTKEYPDGTLVGANGRRLWVENGTKIEWEKKPNPAISKVTGPIEEKTALTEVEIEALNTRFLTLITIGDNLTKQERMATADYKAVSEKSRSFLETKGHQAEQVAAAKAVYDSKMASIASERDALAKAYKKMEPAVAQLDLTGNPKKGYERMFAFARQVAKTTSAVASAEPTAASMDKG